eukprot:SAG11_NODE_578_length_8373_cov_28.044471_6_plen_90_part_00
MRWQGSQNGSRSLMWAMVRETFSWDFDCSDLKHPRFALLCTCSAAATAAGTRLGSAHRLPEGVKSKLASTLEESEVLPVFNVLEARLVA